MLFKPFSVIAGVTFTPLQFIWRLKNMAQISINKLCPIPSWEMPPYIQRGEVLGYLSKQMRRDVPCLRNIETSSKRIGQCDAKGSAE
jgi:hypothetical protein